MKTIEIYCNETYNELKRLYPLAYSHNVDWKERQPYRNTIVKLLKLHKEPVVILSTGKKFKAELMVVHKVVKHNKYEVTFGFCSKGLIEYRIYK